MAHKGELRRDTAVAALEFTHCCTLDNSMSCTNEQASEQALHATVWLCRPECSDRQGDCCPNHFEQENAQNSCATCMQTLGQTHRIATSRCYSVVITTIINDLILQGGFRMLCRACASMVWSLRLHPPVKNVHEQLSRNACHVRRYPTTDISKHELFMALSKGLFSAMGHCYPWDMFIQAGSSQVRARKQQ